MLEIEKINWDKVNGFIPVIIQHAITGKVLMLGYMNPLALEETLTRKQVVFHSRTKNRLWMKGETSGNTLTVVSIFLDCDADSLLILASPTGNTCHQGWESCFHPASFKMGFIPHLEGIIEQRKKVPYEQSYVSQLLAQGINRIAQKVGEEAVETAIAAVAENDELFKAEITDLFFHLLILLAAKGYSFSNIIDILQSRATARKV